MLLVPTVVVGLAALRVTVWLAVDPPSGAAATDHMEKPKSPLFPFWTRYVILALTFLLSVGSATMLFTAKYAAAVSVVLLIVSAL